MSAPFAPAPHLIPPPRDTSRGNRCGHVREAPTLGTSLPIYKEAFSPSNPDKKPIVKFCLRAMEKVSRYYYRPDEILPSLARRCKGRLHRSEGREAVSLVATCLIRFMNVATLEVGRISPTGEFIEGIGYANIAAYTGLSLSQVTRAIEILVERGFVYVKRISQEYKDGIFRGYNSLIAMSVEFFSAIGMGKWLPSAMKKAKVRQAKTAAQAETKYDTPGRAGIDALVKKPRKSPTAATEAPKKGTNGPRANGTDGPKPLSAIFAGIREALGTGPPNHGPPSKGGEKGEK